MADDPNPTVSGQLTAARAVLGPQTHGMRDLAATTVSSDLRAKILEVVTAREHRDALLVAALSARDAYIAALTALEVDGYPELPSVQIANSLFAEMQEEQADLMAAIGVFVEVPRAASIIIGLGAPVAKT